MNQIRDDRTMADSDAVFAPGEQAAAVSRCHGGFRCDGVLRDPDCGVGLLPHADGRTHGALLVGVGLVGWLVGPRVAPCGRQSSSSGLQGQQLGPASTERSIDRVRVRIRASVSESESESE
jgi:hypothetical protein